MAKWYVGTVVCGSCKSLLNIKSISESIECYLCNEMIDLSSFQVVVDDEATKTKDADNEQAE